MVFNSEQNNYNSTYDNSESIRILKNSHEYNTGYIQGTKSKTNHEYYNYDELRFINHEQHKLIKKLSKKEESDSDSDDSDEITRTD